jgi:hypothetical protein
MLYRLTSITAAISYNSVTVLYTRARRDFRNALEDVSNASAILCRNTVSRRNVRLGNHENMHRCLRSYIVKSIANIILVSFF